MYHDYIEKHLTALTLDSINKSRGSQAFKYYYQEKARVYLDEYEDQKELRINWFGKNHDVFKNLYTRFLRRN